MLNEHLTVRVITIEDGPSAVAIWADESIGVEAAVLLEWLMTSGAVDRSDIDH